MARALNRGYLDGAMTAYLEWPLVAALYPNLPYAAAGLVVANEPWSGGNSIGSQLWVAAHWTEFARPGWSFVDSASGAIGGDERRGTYVTLTAPGAGDCSIVETTTAASPQDVRFTIAGGLSTATVHVWETDTGSSDPSKWFVHLEDRTPSNGSYALTLQPNRIYTLSTTTGQRRGAASRAGRTVMELPYADGFESYPIGGEAKYLSNMQGDFQVQPCLRRRGRCTLARGVVPSLALHAWHRLGLAFDGPTIGASIDGRQVSSRRDATYRRGQVGIGVGGYAADQFDNLSITPLDEGS
jgi:glycosyl hydrolase family 59/glycosyl hydrolase family 59 (putative galactocerebrosidase)